MNIQFREEAGGVCHEKGHIEGGLDEAQFEGELGDYEASGLPYWDWRKGGYLGTSEIPPPPTVS